MKTIAITAGDPAGIGPEVALKALSSFVQKENGSFVIDGVETLPVIIGDASVIRTAIRKFRLPFKTEIIESSGEDLRRTKTAGRNMKNNLFCIDAGLLRSFARGRPDVNNGSAAVAYIKKAVELALSKRVDAIVTAPVSKESLKLAGAPWPGHTEMLAELTSAKDFAMMFSGGPLKLILVTIHVPLKDVPGLITRRRVLKTIRLAKRACDMLMIDNPRIAVAGLNPHAGEAGILGREELREIAPAVKKAREDGLLVYGPCPPDVIFNKAYKGEFDIIVCMYHDQGLIPFKMIAFDKGVNITVGLPVIRTSPDHGTAYEIAWKGVADPSSMIEAIRMANRLKLLK